MPYKSKAQQRFMHATNPDVAKKWDKETNFKNLPDHLQHKANVIKQALSKVRKKK